MNLSEVKEVLSQIEHKDWIFIAEQVGPLTAIQAQFQRLDSNTGELGWGQSRWEYLFRPSVDEVVKTCFVLVKLTTEHETMEFFKFQGQRLFDPHLPVDVLIGRKA